MLSQLKGHTEGRLGDGVPPAGYWRALRIRIGVMLIVVFSLYSTVRPLLSVIHSLSPMADVFKYETRFDQVKKYLPPDQIVGYSDNFTSQPEKECAAFVLAQYSLAPVALETMCSKCGYVAKTSQVSARWSGLFLENLNDSKAEPYLLDLFPIEYFQSNSLASARDLAYPSNQIYLVQDFGHGVRLYEIETR
jgi:hypothetical protein